MAAYSTLEAPEMGLKGRSFERTESPKIRILETWKVIYVASRQERKTALLLERQHIAYYLPLVKSMRQWTDRKKVIEVPLFNGYLFVKPTATQRDEVLQIPGVVKYLRFNELDAVVTNAEMKTIQSIVAKGYDVSEFDPTASYEIGEKVIITQGPLKGYEGEIHRINNDDYFIVTFENFGQSLKINISKAKVKKLVR